MSSLVTVLIYAIALVVKKGAYVVTVGLLLIVVIPILVVSTILIFPEHRGSILNISRWTLGDVILKAMSTPDRFEFQAWGNFSLAWLVLLLWLAVFLALAYRSFSRESFDSHR